MNGTTARHTHPRAAFSFALPAQWTLVQTRDQPPALVFTDGHRHLTISAEPLHISAEKFPDSVRQELTEEGFDSVTVVDRLSLAAIAPAATLEVRRGPETCRQIAAAQHGIGYRIKHDGPFDEDLATAFATIRTSFRPAPSVPLAPPSPVSTSPSLGPGQLDRMLDYFNMPAPPPPRTLAGRLRRAVAFVLRALSGWGR